MKTIPFARLEDGIAPLFDEYMAKIGSLIENTEFIGGKEVDSFELEFAAWTGSRYSIGTSNGTDAIIIALKALGVGRGDKVLVPVNTFIATAEAATMVGASVDFIDVEEDYYTMSPASLESYLNSPKGEGVKAIIPVHLYGQMADMPSLAAIARKRGIRIIEDAAQAHGSRLKGKQPGAHGDVATYSFYPGKNIGAFGDAGAVTTNEEGLQKACKMLVNHGRWKAKYEHEIEGFNMRLDSFQAAVLRIKLRHIDEWTKARRARAMEYIRLLVEDGCVAIPKIREGAEPVWHIFPVRSKERDALRKRLEERGIGTGIHYPIPLHLQPAYRRLGYSKGDFPIAEHQASEQLSLPIWPEMAFEDIKSVVAAISGK